jgi:hypothetical protein
MSLLTSGNFPNADDAKQAVRNLQTSGFATDQTTRLWVGDGEPDQQAPSDHGGAAAANAAH